METDDDVRVEGLLDQIQRKRAERAGLLPPRARGGDLLAQVQRARADRARAGDLVDQVNPPTRTASPYWFTPPEMDKNTIPYPRICGRSEGGFRGITKENVERFAEPLRGAGWDLYGLTATARQGATLSGLAKAITGNGEDWRLLDLKGDPRGLKVGDQVNIRPLLDKTLQRPANEPPPAAVGVSPAFVSKVAKYTADWEGRRNRAYRDTEGFWTVGIGFNLSARKEEFQRLLPGVSYDGLIAGKVQLTDEQVDMLFERDVAEDIRKATVAVPDLKSLPEDVKLVLVDMCHQFGSPWPKLSAAIREKDYTEVARQIWSDTWVKQTRRRALDHIGIVREWAKQEQQRKENAKP